MLLATMIVMHRELVYVWKLTLNFLNGCENWMLIFRKNMQTQLPKAVGKQVYLKCCLKPNYYSALKQNDKYETTLFKWKCNNIGKGAVWVWNKLSLTREMPESWAGLQIQARVVIKSMWLQRRTFGLTFEVADAMICSEAEPATCLFAAQPR